jgi:ABC-type multidrug transport system permease subunit
VISYFAGFWCDWLEAERVSLGKYEVPLLDLATTVTIFMYIALLGVSRYELLLLIA